MSLLVLAIEYILFHSIFETIRANDEESVNKIKELRKRNNEILKTWKPLSINELSNIRILTN